MNRRPDKPAERPADRIIGKLQGDKSSTITRVRRRTLPSGMAVTISRQICAICRSWDDVRKEQPLATTNESGRKATVWLTAHQPLPQLANALRSQANQIVEAWIGAVRAAIPAATVLPSQELLEQLPSLLKKMADAMDGVIRHDVDDPIQRSPAQEPTFFQRGVDVSALMTEDRLLRRVIRERVKLALGHPLLPTERTALDAGIDTLLRDALRAQNAWAQRQKASATHHTVATSESTSASTPVAENRGPSLKSPLVTDANPSPARFHDEYSMPPERAAPTNRAMVPASHTRKATLPVFVELPAQPKLSPAAPAPTAAAAESIRTLHDASADTASAAAHAVDKRAERAAESPQASAPHHAAAGVNQEPLLLPAAAFPKISVEITHEWIAVAAYYIWEYNGRQEGTALQDWLEAEAAFPAHTASPPSSN
jgi:hypothetical protein